MELWHGHEKKLCLPCGLDGCEFVYNSISNYRKHVRHWHPEHWLHDSAAINSTDAPLSRDDRPTYDSDMSDDDDCVDTNGSCVSALDSFKCAFARQIMMMQLKISEKYMLPKSTATAIFDDVRSLFDTYQLNISSLIKARLGELGFSYCSDNFLSEIFDCESFFQEATSNFNTDYKMNKYLCENLQLNLPVSCFCANVEETILPVDVAQSTADEIPDEVVPVVGACSKVCDVDEVQYVPILKTLQAYLQQPDVWASIHSNKQSSGKLCSFTDGTKWAALKECNPEMVVMINMYSDEVEICNPLGSRKTVHKLSCFYFIVGNIETKYWSSLSNIHLALLCKFQAVKKYGYKRVLQPLLQDLRKLEADGVTIVIDGKCLTVKGTVVTVAGDNLTSHALGGFSTNFSSGRVCRHCMVTYDELPRVHSEDDCVLRSIDNHRYYVQSVQNDSSLRSVYGVNGESCFAELNYFDCITSFPPDAMHDILEGVICIVMNLVIRTAVHRKLVTIRQINATLKSLKFSKVDSADKPGPFPEDFVSRNKHVSGKASEKLCLFRILPLLVGHVMTEAHDMHIIWTLYLLCREIVEIILSPVVNQDWLPHLQMLINHHHSLLSEIAPSCFTPKVHFLIHYPRLMLQFGPLKHLWCMRFEGTHQVFKQFARRVCSFRNITKTLAERFQRKKCYELSVGTFQLSCSSESNTNKVVAMKRLPPVLQHALQSCGVVSRHMYYTNSASMDGEKFTTESFVILDLLEAEEVPVFLKIKFIMLLHGQWKICGTVYNTTAFNSHLHAYEIVDTEQWLVLSPHTLISTQCVGAYEWNGKEVIFLRFKPCRV